MTTKILLLYPNIRKESLIPPVIALLSRRLKNAGYTVDLFDSTDYEINLDMIDPQDTRKANLQVIPTEAIKRNSKGNVYEGFAKKVQSFSPDLIAMTATESTFLLGISILDSMGKREIPTVLGGVFATFAPELALRYPQIDMVVRGEGELPLEGLCEALRKGTDIKRVRGVWAKDKDGSIIKNQFAPLMNIDDNPTDLDIGLFDDWRMYRPLGPRQWRMLSVETHRGCPYPCGYCNSPGQNKLFKAEGAGNFFRKKSPAKVREEIVHYITNYQIEFVFFWADTFFAYNQEEFDEFVEMYKEFKLPFWCQTRAETVKVDPKRIQQLKDIGMYWISFGLEHGNEKFRADVINRRCSNDMMVDAFRHVEDCGVPYTVNNIIGFPDETRDLAFDTVELNRRFKANSRSCSIFMPYKGTALYDLSLRKGYVTPDTICPSNNDRAILNMSSMGRDEIMGISRTFSMYIDFPKNRWGDIAKAEAQTAEGNRIWRDLRSEWIATYQPAAYPLLPAETPE